MTDWTSTAAALTGTRAFLPITKAHPDALEVPFEDVRAGDWIFDVKGERHKVERARVLKSGALSVLLEGAPTTKRVSRVLHDGRIAIVPEHGWTYEGHGYRKLESPDEFPRGEFYETCRCGATFGSGPDGNEATADELLRKHADEANGRAYYDA
jgi:hypothetical protein